MGDKRVAIKLEGGKHYEWFYTTQAAQRYLQTLFDNLKENQAIQVKTGRSYHFIDYDRELRDSNYDIERVMYYIKRYLED